MYGLEFVSGQRSYIKQELLFCLKIKLSLHKANCEGVFSLTFRQKLITVMDVF